jgi:RNA polymerase sigma factor (sigma-70 family)
VYQITKCWKNLQARGVFYDIQEPINQSFLIRVIISVIWYKERINIKSMPGISDNHLLQQLRKEEDTAFEHLYKACFPSIANYIRQNNGNEQDAEDIFQEAVIVLLGKIREPGFVLTSSLKTYLFSISRNLWLKDLRRARLMPLNNESALSAIQDGLAEPENHTMQKLSGWFKKITGYCQKILSALFYHNIPMDKLMLKMGWKNKHTAAQQKYKCLQQIEKLKAKEGA